MKLVKALVVVLFSVLAFPAFSGNEPPVNTGDEYDIVSLKTPFGDTVYGLRCKNGTTNCNYKWDSLCKVGVAKNSDPLGGISDVPGYSRDGDNRPIRMFVCNERSGT